MRESVLASANNDKAESEWKAAKEQVDVIQADITGPNTDDLSNAKARLEACKAAKVEATKEAFDKKKTAAQKEAILAAATFVSKEDDEGGAECAMQHRAADVCAMHFVFCFWTRRATGTPRVVRRSGAWWVTTNHWKSCFLPCINSHTEKWKFSEACLCRVA